MKQRRMGNMMAALCCCATLTMLSLPRQLLAQAAATTAGESARKPVVQSPEDRDRWMAASVDREYKLRYAGSQADQNEILTAVRNMVDPMTKIFMVPSQRMIVVHAPAEAQEQIAKLLVALDQPQPRYRITYTLTELDGTRKLGVQHYSMVAAAGQRLLVKQGSRLPVSIGSTSNWQYYDVGVNFDLTLSEVQGGAILKSKVEQNSVAPDSAGSGTTGPVIRQSTLEGTTTLMLSKPLLLGSLDVPSSTRHIDVEAEIDPVN